MASPKELEQLVKAGEEAAERFAKDADNKPKYTSRAWTGLFVGLPFFLIGGAIGAAIGSGVKSEGVESFERGKIAAKKSAKFIEAQKLGIKGTELASLGKEAEIAEKLHDRLQPNERVFWGAVIGVVTLGPLVPLAATVFNMIDRSFARRAARKAGEKLYTDIVNESKPANRVIS